MSYNSTTGIITAPVSIKDLQQCFGLSQTDLGTLIGSASVNKWAWYKPMRHSSVEVMSDAKRSSVKYGLSPVRNTVAENIVKGSIPMTEENFNLAATSGTEWTYLRPRGGASEPYRLSDFGCETLQLQRGYNHNTKPPIEYLGAWVIKKDFLENIANVYYVDTVPNSLMYDWGLKVYSSTAKTEELSVGALFVDYKAKFGIESWNNINGADEWVIPMNYLLDTEYNNECWRMGFLVYVPQSNHSEYIGLIVSRGTFKSSTSSTDVPRQVSPELCTNQLLAMYMNNYMNYRRFSTYNFRAIPVMVKDSYLGFAAATQSGVAHGRSYVYANNGSSLMIYAPPTGTISTFINIARSDEGQDTSKATFGIFTLGTKYTSNTNVDPSGGSSGIRNINVLCVFTTENERIARDYTAVIDVDYVTYAPNGTSIQHRYNNTVTIRANSKFVANNVEYNGTRYDAGIELTITTVRTFRVT